MMQIKPDLLNETLNLIALARETATNKGDKRAEHFKPIEEGLLDLMSKAWEADKKQKPSILAENQSIQALVDAANDPNLNGPGRQAALERNQIVASMTAGGMDELEIARHLGMTREEVRMIIKINQYKEKASKEDQK